MAWEHRQVLRTVVERMWTVAAVVVPQPAHLLAAAQKADGKLGLAAMAEGSLALRREEAVAEVVDHLEVEQTLLLALHTHHHLSPLATRPLAGHRHRCRWPPEPRQHVWRRHLHRSRLFWPAAPVQEANLQRREAESISSEGQTFWALQVSNATSR